MVSFLKARTIEAIISNEKTKAQMLPSPNRATNKTSKVGTPNLFRNGVAKIATRIPLLCDWFNLVI
jgi:hypothetical protein